MGALLAVAVAVLALPAVAGRNAEPRRAMIGALEGGGVGPVAAPSAAEAVTGRRMVRAPFAVRLQGPRDLVRVRFKRPPRAGLLFDLDTGRVLWRRAPERRLPIASLTKMMTALVVADRIPRGTRIPISRRARDIRGSKVGLRVSRGRRVGVETLLHGLLLASGNDAAVALAERAGPGVPRFVARMNRHGAELGLRCTRFRSPEGLRGNTACAPDLAAIARAVLATPRLARIVRRPRAVMPFPDRDRKLHLATTNPLLRQGYRGTTGVKTGYTRTAGPCLVASATRGRRRLGVVLLDSQNPSRQAAQLLDRGFRALR
jgi:D-alanyl-D-alanine carboxypeptidase (penicillin-binding protein 5/6)